MHRIDSADNLLSLMIDLKDHRINSSFVKLFLQVAVETKTLSKSLKREYKTHHLLTEMFCKPALQYIML